MKKIAVLVSGGGTNLQALIDSGIQISLVLSSKTDAFALERAKAAGIKTAVVLRGENFENEITEVLTKEEIELIVLAGFMSVLSENFVKKFENKIINVHPSLIPAFCGDGFYGLRVHKAALERGVKITGATVHFVNEITDGGPIILQKTVAVLDGDTPETLQKRVMEEAEWVILPQAVKMFCDDKIKIENGIVKERK